jgi:hypothetical protein
MSRSLGLSITYNNSLRQEPDCFACTPLCNTHLLGWFHRKVLLTGATLLWMHAAVKTLAGLTIKICKKTKLGSACMQLHGNRTKYTAMLDADMVYHNAWRLRVHLQRLSANCAEVWAAFCNGAFKIQASPASRPL